MVLSNDHRSVINKTNIIATVIWMEHLIPVPVLAFLCKRFTHGFQNGHHNPLIFCLLPNKLKSFYVFALRSICQKSAAKI